MATEQQQQSANKLNGAANTGRSGENIAARPAAGAVSKPAGRYVRASNEFKPDAGMAVLNLNAKSWMVSRFVSGSFHKTHYAFLRVGTLLRMTASDPANQKKILDWLDFLFKNANDSVEADRASIKVLSKSPDIEGLDIVFSERDDVFKFYINHPKMVRFVKLIPTIDDLALETDRLWYAGVVPDEQREMTFKKLMYPINAITEHFNYVTNVARRQGHPYSAELFLTLLSEQATMRDFIMHHFSDEDTKLFATTVKSIAGIV